jgi:hypothetical protein
MHLDLCFTMAQDSVYVCLVGNILVFDTLSFATEQDSSLLLVLYVVCVETSTGTVFWIRRHFSCRLRVLLVIESSVTLLCTFVFRSKYSK